MKRFGAKQGGRAGLVLGWISSLFLSGAVVTAVIIGASNVQKSSDEEQLSMLREAVTRAAVHCYAVQGAYPADISELEQNYGLVYDHDKYIVDYNCFASNIMPDITVLAK